MNFLDLTCLVAILYHFVSSCLNHQEITQQTGVLATEMQGMVQPHVSLPLHIGDDARLPQSCPLMGRLGPRASASVMLPIRLPHVAHGCLAELQQRKNKSKAALGHGFRDNFPVASSKAQTSAPAPAFLQFK